MPTSGAINADEEVPTGHWNSCKYFVIKKRRIVVSLTLSLLTIALISVFVVVIVKSQYQHKQHGDKREEIDLGMSLFYGGMISF